MRRVAEAGRMEDRSIEKWSNQRNSRAQERRSAELKRSDQYEGSRRKITDPRREDSERLAEELQRESSRREHSEEIQERKIKR